MNFDEWVQSTLLKNDLLESQERLKIIEIIARMKSNIGSTQQWAKELEDALGIEKLVINHG